jgi:hypothetical protein
MAENIDKILKKYNQDIKRHMKVLTEDFKNEVKIVSEQVAGNTEKLEEHDQRFNRIDETLETVKLNMEVIKNDLKQKVSRDEFVILEKRVSLLESKSNR